MRSTAINYRRIGPAAVISALLALLAAGCAMVGPDYSRPTVKVEQTWLETADKKVHTAEGNYKDWWQVFKDPALNGLIDTAYGENLTLRIAGVRVLEARAQLGIFVGEFYPQTQQGAGSYARTRISERDPSARVFQSVYLRSNPGGADASWELDFWGKFRRGIQSADAGLQASIADYDNVLVSLTADVATNYILIRTLEKRLAIASENVRIQTESLQIAEARFKGGTTSQRDVEQAKTVLASTEATIPTLETQLRQTQNALCVLLGLPPSDLTSRLQGPQEIPAPPPQVAVGIPADLLRRRPDIRSAELQAMAQCSRIGVAKADLYPAFSLTGAVGFASSDVVNFYLGDVTSWRSRTACFGPSFQWNLFNYGQITNQVRVQDARFQQLLIVYQNSVLKAQQEVEDNLVAFLKVPGTGQVSGREHRGGHAFPGFGDYPVPGGHHRFYHRPHGPAVPVDPAKRSGRHPGRHLPQPGGGVPGPGGRLADSGRTGFCAGQDQGGHGQAHQLGPPADSGGGGAA